VEDEKGVKGEWVRGGGKKEVGWGRKGSNERVREEEGGQER